MRYQRILAAAGLGVFDVRPLAQEVTVGHDTGQLARDGSVHGLGYAEVSREENIKISLMDLE